MRNETKKSGMVAKIILMVMGCIAGALLLVLAAVLKPETVATIIHWVMIVYGVIIIVGNIPALINGIAHVKTTAGMLDLISAALGILLGIVLIFYQGVVLVSIIGAYMIVFPLLRVLLAHDKKHQWSREWLRIVLGVVLLIFLPALLNAAFTVIHVVLLVLGWGLIALSVISGVVGIIRIAVEKPAPAGKRIYVDYDGDGTVDAVFEERK